MSDYVIDPAWGQERERLAMLEEWTDPMSERRLRALGIGEGFDCLEVGAGSGSIARWLADQVGPSGRVLAVDIDTRFLEAQPDARVEVLRADLLRDALPQRAFDLVHARAVIHHLDEPVLGLERLVACLKPGGRLLVEEPDSYAGSASPHDGWQRCSEVFNRIPSVDLSYGRRLVADLRAVGVADLDAEVEVHLVRGGSRLARFHAMSLEALREHAVATGAMTHEAIDALQAELEDPAFLEPGLVWVAATGRA
jgi:SAM-dependent methyltransferase